MPPLKRPDASIPVVLPPRRALHAARTDVLVVGGGPAGLGAALGAAWAGAKVILVERYGFLGGNATAALVMPLMSFHTQRAAITRGTTRLLPNDHGPGEPIIAGALLRFLERLVRNGGAIPPSLDTGFVVPFDPEIFKWTAIEMLDEAGVEFLFHAFASGVRGDGQVEGVVFETKSGPIVIEAGVTVDCTGDADVAAQAGCSFEVGREPDGLVQPMTLMFRVADFRHSPFYEYVRTHGDQWRGVHGLWELVQKATQAGELNLFREDILFFDTMHSNEVAVNSVRVMRVLGTDVWDLSYAEYQGRRQVRQIIAFLRKHVPGFEESYVMQTGSQIGVRETRRIAGEYRLTADDLLKARKFEDGIARGSYPLDIHNPAGKGTELKHLPPGEWYDIPLRALLPQHVERLLVAGRSISGTHEAHSSYRIMPICMATGHAAGVAAALAVRSGRAIRDVPASQVQAELRRQGASVG
ncbi:MAG TPA: FAD-dependent oxidoreductase [Phycisphaerae bacterium]|nr:FAD-dependent oxidoreductase [Phycisphaerae bacterium]HOJ75170.1 FAD-dependent oxidoreductase [Phycisphaerae bacterium]HOM52479.1 FAD-dependent oxidoreductase [Phycisphaerae bacterium]HON66401.1 FAD-dependent oxidoreductase [Phycisphaerae bacterium]HOQ85928.1 FAD-dependent oxidoreductase [Phycisphaerae bacterium]